ncbi:hypothetical protein [Kineosporia sp. NBRC 101731]|uniref:hypothetical protein n=1 Tax=Kineosporia sp. NBRC 101731 TaxID=3032199 RepID=UPI0024A1BBFA|nr:hypothetical protein [Kineosporia sp. NBRC 101731]GLY28812.1 hypothetical protein Kisp02_21770 [Kineosporia sp. NBRC 101731]
MSDFASTRTSTDDYTAPRRLSTETKASTKTTELIAYGLAVLAVAITALVVGSSDLSDGSHTADPFGAQDALRYITYLTIGYMIARGLAKSGSRDNYDA